MYRSCFKPNYRRHSLLFNTIIKNRYDEAWRKYTRSLCFETSMKIYFSDNRNRMILHFLVFQIIFYSKKKKMFLQHVLNEALKRLFEKNGASSATNSLSIIEYWRQVSHGTFFFFFSIFLIFGLFALEILYERIIPR